MELRLDVSGVSLVFYMSMMLGCARVARMEPYLNNVGGVVVGSTLDSESALESTSDMLKLLF